MASLEVTRRMRPSDAHTYRFTSYTSPLFSLPKTCFTSTLRHQSLLCESGNTLLTILARVNQARRLSLLNMRLLHTKTLQFEEFFDANIPSYAILSHRWGDNEVAFKDMRKGRAPQGSGLAKIENFCKLAAARGLDWAWIDTCCIDKRSSAELSEAINAMYKWYKCSYECYVHLSDVEYSSDELQLKTEHGEYFHQSTGWSSLRAEFRKSSWFTRGWTLQELLAPERWIIRFFDVNWNEIGSLPQLANDVAEITGIEDDFMVSTLSASSAKRMRFSDHASVAKKMSWASGRQTSREEDMAYCLLGLFDVNMPLLYGEGAKKAFYRLQIEIMRNTADESLFAWTSNQPFSGMLAASPRDFSHSGNISRGLSSTRGPYSMTNKGLEFPVPKVHLAQEGKKGDMIILLGCFRDGEEMIPLALRLRQYEEGLRFMRTECDKVGAVSLSSDFKNYTLERLLLDLSQGTRSIFISDPYP